ncbi:hypothetical protein E2C01_029163 [Portunus trituberculatus]|uniref:Uncharacterized protein n=1 Tax=Portunus trituberculatus TaxID=210409 RepID=A0A5B7EMC1_PORTR|nr:hypothetical protein [Portunus trituberculatus]
MSAPPQPPWTRRGRRRDRRRPHVRYLSLAGYGKGESDSPNEQQNKCSVRHIHLDKEGAAPLGAWPVPRDAATRRGSSLTFVWRCAAMTGKPGWTFPGVTPEWL